MRIFKNYRYEIIASIAGAVVMILELVGARMIAPFFGTSIYVWTAMIGVILAALSVGYWYGGILADRRASDNGLMKILIIAAAAVYCCVVLGEGVLNAMSRTEVDVRFATLLSAGVLFAPAAVLLGVVSPYIAKLRVSSLKTAGQTIGRLYAAGTAGSIAGTFLAGYWLIGLLGNRTLGFLLVVTLVLLAFAVERRGWLVYRVLLGVLGVLGVLLPFSMPFGVIADVDSAYSRYIVSETDELSPRRLLATDPFGTQSAQYIDAPDVMALNYAERFMSLTVALQPDNLLVIGGGAFTFPGAVAARYPDKQVDTVEIDPKLVDIAERYFQFKRTDNSRIYHEDGRFFLNGATPNSYDMVFLDAFSSLTPPYQLTTLEATEAVKRSLKFDGVAVANVIASHDDPYARAMAATYRKVFTFVDIYPVTPSTKDNVRQNMIVILTEDETKRAKTQRALKSSPISVKSGLVLTDDFAPIEQLIHR